MSVVGAALPATVLVALFWIRGVEGHAMAWLPLAVRSMGTIRLLSLVLFDRSDAIVATVLAAATAAGSVLVLARGALRTGARIY